MKQAAQARPLPASVPAIHWTFPGGLNENPKPSILEAAAGSYNFMLSAKQDNLKPRLPFDLLGTATNAAQIQGLAQLVKKDNTQTTLVQSGNTVYLWDGGSTFTSKGTVTSASTQLRDTYWALGDYLILTDLALLTVLQKWDGTTLSNATTGLGGTALFAKYGIQKDGRIWVFNIIQGVTSSPHMMVASAFEDPTTFSLTQRAVTGTFTTGLEAFYMLTPDLKPINGAVLFQGKLIISTTNGKLFELLGSDAKTYNWAEFYNGSAATGIESIVNIGNDVMYLRQGGNITTLSSVQTFGDVKATDYSRWIPLSVTNLTAAIAIYDQANNRVLFWLPSGKVLVMFKDLIYALPEQSPINTIGLSPWSLFTTQHASNFNTNAVKYMLTPGSTSFNVFFGDNVGNIYDLNGAGAGDGGTKAIQLVRNTLQIDEEIVKQWPWDTRILTGIIQYRRLTPKFDLTLAFTWTDEDATTQAVVPIAAPLTGGLGNFWSGKPYWSGAFYWNQGAGQGVTSHQNFSPAGKGTGFVASISASHTQQWQVDNVDLY